MPALGQSWSLPFQRNASGAAGAPPAFVATDRLIPGEYVNNNAGALKTSKAYRLTAAFPFAVYVNETSG